MTEITSAFTVRDMSSTPSGERKAGLAPTWVFLKKLSDNTDITPAPAITEIAQGQYKFAYDAETHGEAAGQIDAGASIPNPADRYIDVLLTRDSGRLQTALTSAGCHLDLTQAVPITNTSQTVGDALNAARAQGFGKWALSGNTLRIYAPDGTTIVHTFTLDSPTDPTVRG
jgi:hypothetical protein